MYLRNHNFTANQSSLLQIIQRISTSSKVNTKIISSFSLDTKKSLNISFRLRIPSFHQDNQHQMGHTCHHLINKYRIQ